MPEGAGGQINVGPETVSTAVSASRVGRAAAGLIICWLRTLGLLAFFFLLLLVRACPKMWKQSRTTD